MKTGNISKDIGVIGEEIACGYLKNNGYIIVERNFLCKIGELDIIAFDKEKQTIAIVEVKCRNSCEFGLPCEFVDKRKQRILINTTNYYLMKNKRLRAYPIRMDIVEVLILKQGRYIRHLKNAF